jgi:predicted DCC family thiol-disulfide oxidoreductase YuxK
MKKARLYYDGECPFCNRYAKFKELQACANLELCDARVDKSYEDLGLKLDDGVILALEGGRSYQGVEAIRFLENICDFQGFFFQLQRWVFKTPLLRDGVYSVLKLLRLLALAWKK